MIDKNQKAMEKLSDLNPLQGNNDAFIDALKIHLSHGQSKSEKQRKKLKRKEKPVNDLPTKYKSYKDRCLKKGLDFNLSVDEFYKICNQPCIYCSFDENENGIDRRDSKVGYVHGNVFPCCWKCNMMKYTHSHEDFIEHVGRIYKHLKLN